ncbi:MAG: YMGG-like glycine zipper-containing protein [Pseudomonadota bacterium]
MTLQIERRRAPLGRNGFVVLAGSLALLLAACGQRPVDRALTGGAIGAASGAVVGSTVGSPVTGAVVGGAAGATVGAVTAPER